MGQESQQGQSERESGHRTDGDLQSGAGELDEGGQRASHPGGEQGREDSSPAGSQPATQAGASGRGGRRLGVRARGGDAHGTHRRSVFMVPNGTDSPVG